MGAANLPNLRVRRPCDKGSYALSTRNLRDVRAYEYARILVGIIMAASWLALPLLLLVQHATLGEGSAAPTIESNRYVEVIPAHLSLC